MRADPSGRIVKAWLGVLGGVYLHHLSREAREQWHRMKLHPPASLIHPRGGARVVPWSGAWVLGPGGEGWNPVSATHSLHDSEQIPSPLCASVFPSARWEVIRILGRAVVRNIGEAGSPFFGK